MFDSFSIRLLRVYLDANLPFGCYTQNSLVTRYISTRWAVLPHEIDYKHNLVYISKRKWPSKGQHVAEF